MQWFQWTTGSCFILNLTSGLPYLTLLHRGFSKVQTRVLWLWLLKAADMNCDFSRFQACLFCPEIDLEVCKTPRCLQDTRGRAPMLHGAAPTMGATRRAGHSVENAEVWMSPSCPVSVLLQNVVFPDKGGVLWLSRDRCNVLRHCPTQAPSEPVTVPQCTSSLTLFSQCGYYRASSIPVPYSAHGVHIVCAILFFV